MLEQLPGYAPDLNPDEGIWKHLKCVKLKNLCCQSLSELRVELRKAKERLTARCRDSEPVRTLQYERLLNRPQTKDCLRRQRRRDVQGPGGSHLLREPLFGQALRREGSKGRVARPQEEAWGCPEARREGDEVAHRRS